MKKGFYIRLAGEGISKNRKLYFPYILTCICMIMMYYIVSFLSISKELASIRGGEMLQGLLSMGVFVVAVFALIFLYYTNSFLIRKRKKELGLYNIQRCRTQSGNRKGVYSWKLLYPFWFPLWQA